MYGETEPIRRPASWSSRFCGGGDRTAGEVPANLSRVSTSATSRFRSDVREVMNARISRRSESRSVFIEL